MDRRSFVKSGALAALAVSPKAFAQSEPPSAYPSRPIRIVVAFGPGGSTDVTARAIAPKLQDLLGQRILIDNRPGAGSNIGAEHVARSTPDGYTLFLGTVSNAVNMSLYKAPGYDLLRDFAPISMLSTAPAVLVVHPSVPANNVQELIALAKAKPGQLAYASSGVGTTPHLAGEMLRMRYGIDVTHVAYKGAAPALTDTIAGITHFGFKTALSAIPSIQSGRLRALAVASANRMSLMPDLPTMAESGVPDLEITSWNGLLAPAKTPPEIIDRLTAECAKLSKMADLRQVFADQAADFVTSSPDRFRAFIQTEITRWGEVIRKVGVQV